MPFAWHFPSSKRPDRDGRKLEPILFCSDRRPHPVLTVSATPSSVRGGAHPPAGKRRPASTEGSMFRRLQYVTPPGQQLDHAIEGARKITAAAPLGIRATLGSANRALGDGQEAPCAGLFDYSWLGLRRRFQVHAQSGDRRRGPSSPSWSSDSSSCEAAHRSAVCVIARLPIADAT